MFGEIIGNATVPGALMNAVMAANEAGRAERRRRGGDNANKKTTPELRSSGARLRERAITLLRRLSKAISIVAG